MTDYITPAIAQIASLLRNRTVFASKVRLGNQLTFTDGIKWPEKTNRQAGDYPELLIRLVSSRQQGYTGPSAMKTFGNTAPGVTPTDFVADDECSFELALTHDGVDTVIPNQLAVEIKAAFFNATINLGLSNVKTWGPLSYRQEPKTDTGTKRLVQTFTLPITFRLRKADLIGQ